MNLGINSLLESVCKITGKSYSRTTSVSYNIFDVLGISRKEVIMTRFLADMLNPNGAHKSGDRYLKTFFANVLGLKYDDAPYSVVTEFSMDGRASKPEDGVSEDTENNFSKNAPRRVDIVISGKNTFIPIEVKIDTYDQELQCFDYYKCARNHRGDRLYYLTRDGKAPSENSYGSLSNEERKHIEQISFKSHIVSWLNTVIEQEPNSELKGIFIQYKDAIERFVGLMDIKESEEIKNYILSDATAMKSAMCVAEVIDDAKQTLLFNVFKNIEEVLVEEGYELVRGTSDDEFIKRVNSFYKQTTSTNPEIDFKTKSGESFAIRVDWNLYIGHDEDNRKNNRWAYIPSGNKYDFHSINENVLELIGHTNNGDDKIKSFANEVAESVKNFLGEQ